MNRTLYCIALCLLPVLAVAQGTSFTHADTLRGSITPERAWWDLTYYHLQVRVSPTDSTISGSTTIQYNVVKTKQLLQVDLQRPLRVIRMEQDGQSLTYRQDGDAYFVTLQKPQQPGQTERLTVFYGGKPRVAKRPPWDGGLTWARGHNQTMVHCHLLPGAGGQRVVALQRPYV